MKITVQNITEEYLTCLQVERRFANSFVDDKIKIPTGVPTRVGARIYLKSHRNQMRF